MRRRLRILKIKGSGDEVGLNVYEEIIGVFVEIASFLSMLTDKQSKTAKNYSKSFPSLR